MNFASVFAKSVFPTPVGPAKRKQPVGRFGSFKPARERRTASEIFRIASSWLITRSWSSFSMLTRRSESSIVILVRGMPVILEITSAIMSASTEPQMSFDFSFHSWLSSFIFWRILSILSRNAAAFSKSWAATAWSFSTPMESISFCISFRSGGRVMSLRWILAPASSMTSIALSGKQRPEM